MNMSQLPEMGCVWHEDRWTGLLCFKDGCPDCAKAKENQNRWAMWRHAVNVNRKILTPWEVTDQQLGEFSHEQAGVEVTA